MTSTISPLDTASRSGSAIAAGLLAHYATRARDEPRNRPYHAIVCDALAREARLTGSRDIGTWRRLLGVLETHRDDERAATSSAVAANLVAIAAFGDPADYASLAWLADGLGHERLARLQHRAGRFLEADPALPWTTSAVRRLVAPDLAERLLRCPGTAPRAGRITESCSVAARALLFEGIDPDWALPMVDSVEELLEVTDHGSIVEWRHHLAMVAASPWSTYSRRLVELAVAADRPHASAAIEACVEMCREKHKDREREQVAQAIRRLVAVSGATQREFASWIGTSASRLSTYVAGTVTPSATMMLRITRTSRILEAERERDRESAGAVVLPDADRPGARAAGNLAVRGVGDRVVRG